MPKSLVDILDEHKDEALAAANEFSNYLSMVEWLVKLHNRVLDPLANHGQIMDPKRITEIDYGDYQGTLVYIVGATGYQPSIFWYVKVGYGSCSGCDWLESIRSYSDELTDSEKEEIYKLLHDIASNFRLMNDGDPVA